MVEEEVESLKKFQKSLRAEDREVFQGLLDQCKLYASGASALDSPVKEISLIISVLFVHYKMLLDLETELLKIGRHRKPGLLGTGCLTRVSDNYE